MSIKIEIVGLDALRKAFTNLDREFDAAVQDAVEDTALYVRTEVVTGIQRGPASGRVYSKTDPRRTHQASAPGQPPISDTGRLVSSIEFYIDPMMATVGSRLAYAAYLEYGTTRIAPRPIWTPTAQKAAEFLPRAIEENLRRVL